MESIKFGLDELLGPDIDLVVHGLCVTLTKASSSRIEKVRSGSAPVDEDAD